MSNQYFTLYPDVCNHYNISIFEYTTLEVIRTTTLKENRGFYMSKEKLAQKLHTTEAYIYKVLKGLENRQFISKVEKGLKKIRNDKFVLMEGWSKTIQKCEQMKKADEEAKKSHKEKPYNIQFSILRPNLYKKQGLTAKQYLVITAIQFQKGIVSGDFSYIERLAGVSRKTVHNVLNNPKVNKFLKIRRDKVSKWITAVDVTQHWRILYNEARAFVAPIKNIDNVYHPPKPITTASTTTESVQRKEPQTVVGNLAHKFTNLGTRQNEKKETKKLVQANLKAIANETAEEVFNRIAIQYAERYMPSEVHLRTYYQAVREEVIKYSPDVGKWKSIVEASFQATHKALGAELQKGKTYEPKAIVKHTLKHIQKRGLLLNLKL